MKIASEQLRPNQPYQRLRNAGSQENPDFDQVERNTMPAQSRTPQVMLPRHGADKVQALNPALFEAHAEAVANEVRARTGLALEIPTIKICKSYSMFGKLIMRSTDAALGEPGKKRSALYHWVLGASAFGVYLPHDKAFIMGPAMQNCSLDSFRACMAHELVHAAQDQNYPTFFSDVYEVHKRATASLVPAERKTLTDQVHGRFAWLEGHAMAVQHRVEKETYTHNSQRLPVVSLLASMVWLCFPETWKKLLQYPNGEKAFDIVVRYGQGIHGVRTLYENPEVLDKVMTGATTLAFKPNLSALYATYQTGFKDLAEFKAQAARRSAGVEEAERLGWPVYKLKSE